MREQVDWALGSTRGAGLILNVQSLTETYYGRLEKAREFARRAVGTAKRGGRQP